MTAQVFFLHSVYSFTSNGICITLPTVSLPIPSKKTWQHMLIQCCFPQSFAICLVDFWIWLSLQVVVPIPVHLPCARSHCSCISYCGIWGVHCTWRHHFILTGKLCLDMELATLSGLHYRLIRMVQYARASTQEARSCTCWWKARPAIK